MKKFGFKKVVAALAALSMVTTGVVAISASASTTSGVQVVDTTKVSMVDEDGNAVGVYIDQIEITLEDLQAANYTLPVYVRLNPNFGPFVKNGLNSCEFGIEIDSRCKQQIVQDSVTSFMNYGEFLTRTPKEAHEGNFYWLTDAEQKTYFDSSLYKPANGLFNEVLFEVTVPDTAKAGDTYTINYQATGLSDDGQSGRKSLFKYGTNNYTSEVTHVDGYIHIIGGAPETTTTTVATTTTTVATTTTTAKATTTTTEKATTTTTEKATTTTTTEAVATSTSVETGTGTSASVATGTSTSTSAAGGSTSSSGSPQTGAADVLPIAGAAAAVAVLGGVALVAKKKND